HQLSVAIKLGTPKLCHTELREVPVPLVQVEAVADEKLVRNDEADVADREIVDEPAVRPVEQGRDRKRGRPTEGQQLPEGVQRQAGVDHVLDDQHVPTLDGAVQVLQEAHPLVAARDRAAVTGELDEVELMDQLDSAREVGKEEQGALERRDE